MIQRRLAAFIYDLLIILSLWFILTMIVVACRQGLAIAPHSHWYQSMLLTLYASYFIFSYRYGGQTIGMRAWNIKLVSGSSFDLNWTQVIKRFMLFLPAWVMIFIYRRSPYALLCQWTSTAVVQLQQKSHI